MEQPIWHSLNIKEIFTLLKTKEGGLGKKEVLLRLKKFGPNKLPEEKKLSGLQIFINQFRSPLVYILFIAAFLTLLFRDFIEAGVILVAVLLNTFIGFFEERKAEKIIEKLKKMMKYKAKVLRDKRSFEVEIEELVPGDIILIEAGDKIPADARIIEGKNLQVVEAALTGESMPSRKSIKILAAGTNLAGRENMVYMGTNVVRGRGKAVVVATGIKTEIGKVALMIKETIEEKTPLQQKLNALARWLSIIILFICFVIFIIGVLQGRSFIEMLLIVVAAAVAAVPEGLLVTITVILAIGMQRILKEKALVKKLVAAETLGSTSIICTDKTGTLTLGKMVVDHIFTWSQSEKTKMKVLEIGLLCNNAVIGNPEEELKDWVIFGDPVEQALLLAALQAGLDRGELLKEKPRLDEIPFDEEKKFMAVLCQRSKVKSQKSIFVKGAPEKVMAMSGWLEVNGKKEKFIPERREKFEKEIELLTNKGLRLLAVGYKEVLDLEHLEDEDLEELTFVGLVALKDPLRKEAKEAIKLCREAGIKPILVTGDHKLTAKTIGSEIGLLGEERNILEGSSLDKLSDEEFSRVVKNIDIFTRVEPRHKLRIIDIWQKKGEIVAMTGDGVNDAPALKKADIGIALGSGTDVAKEASEIILLDDNFMTIIEAIRQGRIIFENIRKVVLYLFSDIFTELFLIIGSLIFGLPLPVLATQILWVNLIEDSPPAMALAFDPGERGIIKEKPHGKNEPIIDFEMKLLMITIGLFTSLSLFGLFYYFWQTTGDLNYVQTIIFTSLGMDSLLYIFSCRSLRYPIWQKNPFQNKFLNLSFTLGILMYFLVLYLPFFQKIFKTIPLGLKEWGVIISLDILNIILIEIIKYIFITKDKRKNYESIPSQIQ